MNKDNKFLFAIRQKQAELTTATRVDVDIYGAIVNGSAWYDDEIGNKEVLDTLGNLSPEQEIVLHINSVGGDVASGVSIYNRLKAMPNKKSVIIEGLAASIASIIAMAGDDVHMALGSEMMIHNPATYVFGDTKDLEKAINSLVTTKESLIDIYEQKTGLSREELSDMMDAETWLTSTEALEKGFCNSIDESLQMVARVSGENLVVNGMPMNLGCLKGLSVDSYQVMEGGEKMAKQETQELQEMTVDTVREQYPEVFNVIFTQGVEHERQRMQELDAINTSNRADMINRAKYETFAQAKDVALELLQEEATSATALQNRLQDADVSNGLQTKPQQETDPVQVEESKLNKVIDAVMARRAKK